MSDFEGRLRDELRAVGETYEPTADADAHRRFRSRRRRRAVRMSVGATLLSGAAAVVAFQLVGSGGRAEQDAASRAGPAAAPTEVAVVAEVAVGDAPSGIGSGGGYVWVANTGDDTVSKVDAGSNKVARTYPVSGGPDDVIISDGFAWISTEAGRVVALDVLTSERRVLPAESTFQGHLDLAPAGNGEVWIAAGGSSLHKLGVGREDVATTAEVGVDLRDVAANGNDVWAYDGGTGDVLHLDNGVRVLARTPVGRSTSADLATSDDFTWSLLGDTGTLVQIDNATGEVTMRTDVGGTFGALAEENGVLFVMVTQGGDEGEGLGRLYRIDARNAQKMGDPLPLTDLPYDVEAGADGVWVTNNAGDSVTRVEIRAAEEGSEGD